MIPVFASRNVTAKTNDHSTFAPVGTNPRYLELRHELHQVKFGTIFINSLTGSCVSQNLICPPTGPLGSPVTPPPARSGRLLPTCVFRRPVPLGSPTVDVCFPGLAILLPDFLPRTTHVSLKIKNRIPGPKTSGTAPHPAGFHPASLNLEISAWIPRLCDGWRRRDRREPALSARKDGGPRAQRGQRPALPT